MAEHSARLAQAFAALDGGDLDAFEALFAPDGQWLGVPGSGFEGATPI
jgi:ketosteroid isomerase-like protein